MRPFLHFFLAGCLLAGATHDFWPFFCMTQATELMDSTAKAQKVWQTAWGG
jgi:hypothetical protein